MHNSIPDRQCEHERGGPYDIACKQRESILPITAGEVDNERHADASAEKVADDVGRKTHAQKSAGIDEDFVGYRGERGHRHREEHVPHDEAARCLERHLQMVKRQQRFAELVKEEYRDVVPDRRAGYRRENGRRKVLPPAAGMCEHERYQKKCGRERRHYCVGKRDQCEPTERVRALGVPDEPLPRLLANGIYIRSDVSHKKLSNAAPGSRVGFK